MGTKRDLFQIMLKIGRINMCKVGDIIIVDKSINLSEEAVHMAKISGNTHTQSQMNHHANQENPNNSAYKSAQNNHANQCNPKNSAYNSSRGKK